MNATQLRSFGGYQHVKFILRLIVVVLVVGSGLFLPQRLAWGAPETRMKQFDIASGQRLAVPFPATHVAVSWEGDHDASVELRGQNKGDEWSAWKPAANDDTGEGERYSGMVLVDDAVKLEVRVTAGRAQSLKLDVIDAENGPRKLTLVNDSRPAQALDGYTGQPSIISRSDWGADESLKKGDPLFADINRIIIHHTATDNDDPNPAATVRAVYAWHTQGNGWDDIGYNFLIDQQGRIYEGRYARSYAAGETPTGENLENQGVIGAHALNNNTGSVGISLLGTFTNVSPSPAQLNSLENLIAWKADRHNLDIMSEGVVIGHRDVGQTSCPGEITYSKLGEIREQANLVKTLAYPPGNTPGYWIASTNGDVAHFGTATDLGSMVGKHLNSPIASMTRTSNGQGYWLMANDGGIFSFGNAQFEGSMGGKRLNKPIVGLAPTPSGNGYWLVASDGGIFAFGDAQFYGSMGGQRLNKPIVGMASTKTGNGYWLVASDGGIFAFGDAQFYGSTGSIPLNEPVVTMMATPKGAGYWMIARDGGMFAFGDAPFRGSIPMLKLGQYAGTVQAAATATGLGYYMLSADGGVYSFGDAKFFGSVSNGGVAGIALVPE